MLDSIINLDTFSRIIAIVVAITVHEYSHAWTANRLGDPTAKYEGRLSLNPVKHLDPIGTLVLVILIFTTGFGFGWGKPVPVNPYNLRGRYGELWVSLAGPFSNFITAAILVLVQYLLPPSIIASWSSNFIGLLNIVAIINVAIGIFNLIPIPPLDGSKVLFDLLPPGHSEIKAAIEKYGIILFFVALFFAFGFLSALTIGAMQTLLAAGQALRFLIYHS